MILPQAEAANKRVLIVASATGRRQLLQFMDISPAQDDFVRLKSRTEASDDVEDKTE